MTARAPRALAAAVLLTLAVACSGPPSSAPEGEGTTVDTDALAQLQARPRSEDIVATYTRMEADIRAAVTAAAPQVQWVLEREQGRSGCQLPFSNLGGRTVALESYGAPEPITDEQWPTVRDAAQRIAAAQGFTATVTKVDKPDDHQIRFADESTGAYTDLLTGKAVVLSTRTGCHLPADAATP